LTNEVGYQLHSSSGKNQQKFDSSSEANFFATPLLQRALQKKVAKKFKFLLFFRNMKIESTLYREINVNSVVLNFFMEKHFFGEIF
jgi:hypothetical protein